MKRAKVDLEGTIANYSFDGKEMDSNYSSAV